MRKSRFRRLLDNPARGLEYNEISHNRRISRRIYAVDIANNPRLVKDGGPGKSFLFVDVLAEADKIHGEAHLINARRYKVEGRT